VKPVRVKIATPNELLTAGQPMPIRCESWGSYPAAKITWLLDGEPIRNAEVTVHSDKEVSKCPGQIARKCLTILWSMECMEWVAGCGESFRSCCRSQDIATLCPENLLRAFDI